MSKYICTYCLKELASKSSLNNHLTKAQYCIKKRKNISDIIRFNCKDCYNNFTSKQSLQLHSLKCKARELNFYKGENDTLKTIYDNKIIYLENQINQKDDIIKDLQNKLENIAISAVSRPTTSNKTQINNYIQQLQPVTDEHFVDNVQHLTIDHIMKGPEGYAQYALEYPLKDRLICVDYARRKVKFKNKDGNVITDPEMSNLATKFFNSIKDKNKELIIECGEKLKENFGDELDTIVKIFDYKSGVEKGSDGERSEFHHDFVKQVCSQTIKE